jgi:FG-GAP-like repeat
LAKRLLKERRMDRRFQGRGWSVAFGPLACAGLLACIGVALGVAALLAGSAPSFAAARNYTTGSNPLSVAIGDLNGDRKPDLATANFNEVVGSISVLLNRGDGSFRAKFDYALGRTSHSLAVGDLNGDGNPDLAITDSARTVSVLFNGGTAVSRRSATTGSDFNPRRSHSAI